MQSWRQGMKSAEYPETRAENLMSIAQHPGVMSGQKKRYSWGGAMSRVGLGKWRKNLDSLLLSYNPFSFFRSGYFQRETSIRDRLLLWKSQLIGCFPHNRNKLPCFTLSLFIETKRQPNVCRGHQEQHPASEPLAKNKLQIPPGLSIPSIPHRNTIVVHLKSVHPSCVPFLSRKNPI